MSVSTTQLPKAIVFTRPGYAASLCAALQAAWGEVPRAWTPDQVQEAVLQGARLVIADEPDWLLLSAAQRALLEEHVKARRLRVVVLASEASSAEQLGQPVHLMLPPSMPTPEMLDALYGLLASQDVHAGPPLPSVGESRRVLVVDDSELLNRITRSVLSQAGYRVTCITNPFELYRLLREDPPDLVLVDYNIPTLRGDSLIDIIRRAGMELPMVLYSNASETTLKDAAERCGASGYIRKGVAAPALLGKLDTMYRQLVPARAGTRH